MLVQSQNRPRQTFHTLFGSERPIQQNMILADTDNRPVLPIISADISAENQAKNGAFPVKIVPYF